MPQESSQYSGKCPQTMSGHYKMVKSAVKMFNLTGVYKVPKYKSPGTIIIITLQMMISENQANL